MSLSMSLSMMSSARTVSVVAARRVTATACRLPATRSFAATASPLNTNINTHSSASTRPNAPALQLPLGVADPAVFRLSLQTLRDNPGATRERIRVGRGLGGRRGGKCGKGQKGQKARTGGSRGAALHEGGQTRHYMQHRKFGFSNAVHAKPLDTVNVGRLQELVHSGLITPGQKVTMKTLHDLRVVKNPKFGVKLLGGAANALNVALDIELSAATPRAVEAVEKAGGKIKKMYYSRQALRYLLHPEKFEFPIKRAKAPPSVRDRFDDWGQDLNGAETDSEDEGEGEEVVVEEQGTTASRDGKQELA